MGALLGDVLARPVPVSVFLRYRVSLQREKCCQQIIGLDDESVLHGGVHRRKKNPCFVKCSAMP